MDTFSTRPLPNWREYNGNEKGKPNDANCNASYVGKMFTGRQIPITLYRGSTPGCRIHDEAGQMT